MNSPWFVPLVIALGAVPGALSRYHLTRLSLKKLGSNFPYGTFIVNLSGSFLIGFASEILIEMGASEALKLFVSVGFLGAYTTFSTYELDASTLFEMGEGKWGWLYWLGSPVLGILGVQLGTVLARLF